MIDKLIERDLKDLGSVINSFSGGGKSEIEEKKADICAGLGARRPHHGKLTISVRDGAYFARANRIAMRVIAGQRANPA
jgi:hypothetical protein